MGKPTSDFSLKRGINIDKHDSLSVIHRIKNLIMPPTLKKLMGHIAFGACVGASHFLYLL